MDPLLNDPDVRVDVFSNIAGGSVRITHLPTGLVASAEYDRREDAPVRSSIQAKELAARELRKKLATAQPPAEGFVLVSGVSGDCVCGQPR
jgi:protein subunit release factor A